MPVNETVLADGPLVPVSVVGTYLGLRYPLLSGKTISLCPSP